MSTPASTDVIHLSRWRAALARARSRPRRLVEMLERPEAVREVRRLPPQELYDLTRVLGQADSIELVALASPGQLRALVDLDCWKGGEIDLVKLTAWIDVVSEGGPERWLAFLRGLDLEVAALLFQRHARIHDLTQGEEPAEDATGHLWTTPDRFFVLEVEDDEEGRKIGVLLDLLYRLDQNLARKLIAIAKWELPSDLEEHALRWRAGRLADLGYPDPVEAMAVYAPVDLGQVRIDEHSAQSVRSVASPPEPDEEAGGEAELPGFFAVPFEGESLLTRSLAALHDDAELERVSQALLWLTNRVLAADRTDPGDLEAARQRLLVIRSTLDLGLDFLARGDAARGAEALANVALVRIFQTGHTLVTRLSQLARALAGSRLNLTGKPSVARVPSLIDDEDRALLEGLLLPRPRLLPLSATADAPASSLTLGDLERATRQLERIALSAEHAFGDLGFDPERLSADHGGALPSALPPVPELRLWHLLATGGANLLLERGLTLPLGPAELRTLLDRGGFVAEDGSPGGQAGGRLLAHLRASATARGGQLSPLIEAYVPEVMARIHRELGGLVSAAGGRAVDLRFVGGLLLRPD